jgi:uncharacterized protein
MKIAVISDIHDNLANLEIFLAFAKQQGLQAIFCCGDVTNDDTIEALVAGFAGSVYLVRGNADNFSNGVTAPNLHYLGRVGLVELDGHRFGLCHEPFLIPKVLEKGACEAVFYGHTHKPWESVEYGVRAINPGPLGGMFMMATAAVFDTTTGQAELKLLANL